MNRELLEPYEGQDVKLVLDKDFCLWGHIDKVYIDCLLFTTRQKTALIRFERIMEVVPR